MLHYQVKAGDIVLVDIRRETPITIDDILGSYIFDDYPPETWTLVFIGEE